MVQGAFAPYAMDLFLRQTRMLAYAFFCRRSIKSGPSLAPLRWEKDHLHCFKMIINLCCRFVKRFNDVLALGSELMCRQKCNSAPDMAEAEKCWNAIKNNIVWSSRLQVYVPLAFIVVLPH